MTAISPGQIRAIHTLKSRLRLAETDYRDALASFGADSSKALTHAQAATLIDRLQGRSAPAPAAGRNPSETLSGPYAAKLRALWLSAWHLGIVRERDDRAILAFIRRQTGLSHDRWLGDPIAASAVIEALKAMMAREAGVAWPESRNAPVVALQNAILDAQEEMLRARGAWGDAFAIADGEDLNAAIARRGAVIRNKWRV